MAGATAHSQDQQPNRQSASHSDWTEASTASFHLAGWWESLRVRLIRESRGKQERHIRRVLDAVAGGGAYVGEVIRPTTTTVHQWVDLEVWIAANPDHADMLSPQSLTLPAVLSPGLGGFTLPVTKVAKCIVKGPIDAVSYYVRVWLRAYP